jgi:hypothetical protein
MSNQDWESPADSDARIAKMKDGRTRLAHKPEHAVDLDTGAIVGAKVHHADRGDTKTLPDTLEETKTQLESIEKTPTSKAQCDLVGDKGYHSRGVLKDLDGGPWKTRIAERKPKGLSWWKGDKAARRAVYNNRTRLSSGVGKQASRLRTELVERSFEHTLDRGGGMRRTSLRGKENVEKRYLIQAAGFNLGLLMRSRYGNGTPRGKIWALAIGIPGVFSSHNVICLLIMFKDEGQEEWKPAAVGIIRLG